MMTQAIEEKHDSLTAPQTVAQEAGLEKFFIHVDLRDLEEGNISKTARRINNYMIGLGFYDPRRANAFLDTLLAPGQTLATVSLSLLRELGGIGTPFYYELWCVRGTFSVDHFLNNLRQTTLWDFQIKLYAILDNEVYPVSAIFSPVPVPIAAPIAAFDFAQMIQQILAMPLPPLPHAIAGQAIAPDALPPANADAGNNNNVGNNSVGNNKKT